MSDTSPYAHAVRHLDEAEEWRQNDKDPTHYDLALIDVLLGIGWAILAEAAKR